MNRIASTAFAAAAAILLTGATEIQAPPGAMVVANESLPISLKFIAVGPMPIGTIELQDGRVGLVFRDKATFALTDESGDQEKAVAFDCAEMKMLQESLVENLVISRNALHTSAEKSAPGTFNVSYTLTQVVQAQKSLGCNMRLT